MDLLKEASIESNLIWKAAGKPKHGPISVSGNRADFNIVGVLEKIKIMKLQLTLIICTMLLWKKFHYFLESLALRI